jgi:hypothetical protein
MLYHYIGLQRLPTLTSRTKSWSRESGDGLGVAGAQCRSPDQSALPPRLSTGSRACNFRCLWSCAMSTCALLRICRSTDRRRHSQIARAIIL